MEAVVGGCLLVAAADGEIEQSEIEKMQKLMCANDALSAFKPSEINAVIERFTELLETDFDFGKKKILDEISEIASDKTQCEDVLVCMIAIAKTDGKIDDSERKVLLQVAKMLRLNASSYGLK